jgi:murein DD-endopeptidase MepM/ murein hydrolase activator NlpD
MQHNSRDNGGRPATILERIWAWIHATFPERQIYIRSDGRVQFFTFGPSLQATLAGLCLIFLGWVAFATVNVVFRDRIVAARDEHFREMQSAYESRLADLQLSYDDLNGALVGAQDRFKATADVLATKQKALAGFLARKAQIEAQVGQGAQPVPSTINATGGNEAGGPAAAMAAPDIAGDDPDGASLTVMPGPVAPQPRTAKPSQQTGFLDTMMTRIGKLAGALFPAAAHADIAVPAAYAQHPALRALHDQTSRLEQLASGDDVLMVKTEQALEQDVSGLKLMVRRTGIDPDLLERNAGASEGIGGPEIPLSQVHLQGVSDPAFTDAYLRAQAVMGELTGLSQEVSHIPLAAPVETAIFDKSSGFGSRIDPFTGRYAFHPGIDFAGPWGARVAATASGKVVFAGYRGGYGNMVEIDHGYGIHTRYGHLSAINVKLGAEVAKGATLGRVGSTGRSTGPHVHYEVLFDDAVRNPSNFIEAGRHVL